MSERVPEGWVKIKLGEVGKFSTSSVDKKSSEGEREVSLLNYMDVYRHSTLTENYPFQKVTAPNKQISSSSVQRGDVFFTPSSETPDDIGCSAVFIGDAKDIVHSYHTVRFRPSSNEYLDDDFKSYAFKGSDTYEYFRKRATGTTRFTLPLPVFNELEITVPPLPEQKKIASILTSVDEVIEKTQSQIDKLQNLKKATMNELLTRGIGHTEFKDSELGRIPEGWSMTSFEEISSNRKTKFQPSSDTKFIYVGLEHLKSESRKINKFGNSIDIISTKTQFFKGDTLFGKLRPYLRKVSYSDCEGVCSTDILAIAPTNNSDSVFLYYVCSSDKFIKNAVESSAGNIMPRASWNDLATFPICLPPLPEQRKIASILTSIDKVIEQTQSQLEQTQSLKKSLMQDLLTGKVRVSVN